MVNNPVGIVTLPGDNNLGNRLQNYALQEAIFELGFHHVETIEGLPRDESPLLRLQRLAATGYARRAEISRKLLRQNDAPAPDLHLSSPERYHAISQFTDEFIRQAPQKFPRSEPAKHFIERYHGFVLGSDQVWNPAFTHANPEWFLSFARPEQRIAYAASMGISQLPNYLRSRYRRGIAGIGSLSVREERAAQIIQELTGLVAPVVLDPTMLLSSERWKSFALPWTPEKPGNYLVTFMLSSGDTKAEPQGEHFHVEKIARELDLEVFDLFAEEESHVRAVGPREFLGAIRDAQLVITDSFHAAVFATLFHKPFFLVSRGDMNSRFDTLLHHTGLTHRMLLDVSDLDASRLIDWDSVDQRLSTARDRSLTFLHEALGAIRS